MTRFNNTALVGTGLAVLYTLMISSADAITKFIAKGYAAPQLFALSGAIVVGLAWVSSRAGGTRQPLRTSCPRAMALKAALTIVGSAAFFYAFRYLPFAEVFVFIGLMPIFAGLFSAPILSEHVRPMAWAALAAGFVGVLCLFPAGLSSVSFGHGIALIACLCGTLSMVLARYIGRHEDNALSQVLFTNLALSISMALVLPFVFVPMPLSDLVWVAAYAVFLFAARRLLVVSLRLLKAYTVTPLMNLQFVWMVVLGAVFFGEVPATNIYLGVAIVIGSGVFLVWDQMQPDTQVSLPRFSWIRRIRFSR
ncbi:DMT family transporter [uncultured Shimia sp.]|uniref:DMT family transporter n=1 Tax=uncultured Shimia sp. TaxID=573152 RepID=UPI002612FA56|nr:DMT family transporter [uncultured Shimia sp.]